MQLFDRFRSKKDSIVVIDDGEAYVIPITKLLESDLKASEPCTLKRGKKIVRELNADMDRRRLDAD